MLNHLAYKAVQTMIDTAHTNTDHKNTNTLKKTMTIEQACVLYIRHEEKAFEAMPKRPAHHVDDTQVLDKIKYAYAKTMDEVVEKIAAIHVFRRVTGVQPVIIIVDEVQTWIEGMKTGEKVMAIHTLFAHLTQAMEFVDQMLRENKIELNIVPQCYVLFDDASSHHADHIIDYMSHERIRIYVSDRTEDSTNFEVAYHKNVTPFGLSGLKEWSLAMKYTVDASGDIHATLP